MTKRDRVLYVKDVAKRCGVSEARIYQLITAGEIPMRSKKAKPGKRGGYQVLESVFREWYESDDELTPVETDDATQ